MTRDQFRSPTHPGAILREDVIPALDLTVTGMAEQDTGKTVGLMVPALTDTERRLAFLR